MDKGRKQLPISGNKKKNTYTLRYKTIYKAYLSTVISLERIFGLLDETLYLLLKGLWGKMTFVFQI